MSRDDKSKQHKYISELKKNFKKGTVDRREFLRTSTLLGLSAAAAYAFAGGPDLMPGAHAATPKKGGTLRFSMRVQEMTDPAKFDWTEKSNVARQVIEYYRS